MKKALSLLLAVLMLVSLFSGMAFADDDVIVEEPVATDEFVGDDYVEAADAYVEEYTDEGSFEAADAFAPADIEAKVDQEGWIIVEGSWEWKDPTAHPGKKAYDPVNEPAKQVCEDELVVYCKIPSQTDPTVYGDPVPVDVIIPHNWDQNTKEVVFDPQASCEEGGHQVTRIQCSRCKEWKVLEEKDVQRLGHNWVKDKTYTGKGLNGDDRAIVVAPTCQADGKGHVVCSVCGQFAPSPYYDELDAQGNPKEWKDPEYVIKRQVSDGQGGTKDFDPTVNKPADCVDIFHSWGAWTPEKVATCLKDGNEVHICNLCHKDEYREVKAYNHSKNDARDDWKWMKFDHIERLDCKHYAEVWVCTNPNCYSKYDETLPGWVASDTPSQYTEYVYNSHGDHVYTLKDAIAKKNDAFLYTTTDYAKPYNNNTEFYDHHRFNTEYDFVEGTDKKPTCEDPGTLSRKCAEDGCNYVDFAPVPALGHDWNYEVVRTGKDGTHYYHYLTCKRCNPQGDAIDVKFGKDPKLDPDKDTEKYYSEENKLPKTVAGAEKNSQVLVVPHEWNEWVNWIKPVESGPNQTEGLWYRTCKIMSVVGGDPNCLERQEFRGTQAAFDAMVNPPHPVLTTGIIKDEDGAFKLYKMGVFDKDFTGIYDGYNYVLEKSGKWYVVEGIWENDAMGATLVGSTWYFLANGKVQEVTQLAEYQGEWFYVVNGVFDTSKNALVEYDTGLFVVAAGRIVDEYSGLWLNDKSIGGDGEWYYVANGQVQKDYTGITFYDGRWFYLENGKLIPDYTGEVEYDGEVFEFVDGKLVA